MSSINLTWVNDVNADSYNVYRSTSTMNPTSLPAPLATGILTKSYSDTTTTANTKYYYRVASVIGGVVRVSSEIIIYSQTYSQTVLNDNPIAYYPLTETSGILTNDIMSNPSNGYSMGVSVGQTPLAKYIGTSYYFGGDSNILLYTPPKFKFTGSASFEVWFKMNSTGTGTIFTTGYNTGLRIQVTTTLNVIYNSANILSSVAISANTLYHAVVTLSSTTVKIYLNNVLTNTLSTTTWTGVQNNNDSAIGYLPLYGEFYAGYLSNLALYNVELTQAQVTNHYNIGMGL